MYRDRILEPERDRLEALEPDYELEHTHLNSIWRLRGRRRSDGLEVVVTVLPRRGSQLNLARAESYFAPLMSTVGLLEIRSVGDDLFLVWAYVGHLGLTDLDLPSLSPESLSLVTRSVLRALDGWHERNRSYGFPALRGVRINQDLTHAWLVEPDLHRIVEGLSLSDPSTEKIAFERALATWRGADPLPTREHELFAPSGQRAVFSRLASWTHPEPSLVFYLQAPEGSGKTTLLHALESTWAHDGDAVVGLNARDFSERGWIPSFLDQLAENALSMTPLLKRRLVARVRAALGTHVALLESFSPRWTEVLESPRSHHDVSPGPTQPNASLLAEVLALFVSTFASHRPVALLLDDADMELEFVTAFVDTLQRHDAPRVRVLCAVSQHDVPEPSLVLQPLQGDDLERFVAHTLEHPAPQVRALCRQLESTLTTTPHNTLVALKLARTRGWLSLDLSNSQLSLEHLDLLASVGGDPDAMLELLDSYSLDLQVLRVLSILSSSLPSSTLGYICARSPEQLSLFIRQARSAGILHERRDMLRLASFTARIVRESIPAQELEHLHQSVASRLILAERAHLAPHHIMSGWPTGALSCEHLEILSDLAISETLSGRSSSLTPVLERLIEALGHIADQPRLEAHARLAIVKALSARRELERAAPFTEVPAGAPLAESLALMRERVVLHTFAGRYGRALDEGLSALAASRINVNTTPLTLEEQLSRTLELLPDLHKLPRASSKESLRQSLIGALLPVAYIARREAFDSLVFTLVERTFSHGVSLDSVRGFTTLGQLACARLGAITEGTEIGFAAYTIAARTPGHPYLPVVCSDLANFILPWSGRIDDSVRFNRLGRRSADMLGDLQYAGYIRMHDLFNLLTYGSPLDALRARGRRYADASQDNALAHAALRGVLTGLALIDTPRDERHGLYADPSPSTAPLARHLHHLTHALVALALDERDALIHHTASAAQHFGSTEGWVAPTTLQLYLSAHAAYHSGSDDLSTARGALELLTYRIDALAPIVLHVRGLERASQGDDQDACLLFDDAISRAQELDLHAYVALVAQDAVAIASRAGLKGFADSSRRAAARAFSRWGMPRRAAAFGLDSSPSPVQSASPYSLVRASLSSAVDTLRSRAQADRCFVAYFVDAIPTAFVCVDPSREDVIQIGDTIDHGHPVWPEINRCANAHDARVSRHAFAYREDSSSVVILLPGMTDAPPDLEDHARAISSWSHLLQVSALDSGQLSDTSLSLAIGQLSGYLFFVGLDGEGVRLDGSTFPLEPGLQHATVVAVDDHEPSTHSSTLSPGSSLVHDLVCVYFPRVLKLHAHVEPILWLSRQPLSEP